MTNLAQFQFNTQSIRFENRDGRIWVSLTDMAKATDKQVGHWKALDSTTEFLNKFGAIIGIPIIESKVGGVGIPENQRGTWAIEEVAIRMLKR